MNPFLTIFLLIISNVFMTFAWYGHLKLAQVKEFSNLNWFGFVLISWGLAFFEYCFQVPANKFGFKENGGSFTLLELKVMQEVITLLVFSIFTLVFFKNEQIKLNHLIGFVFLVLAVFFIFKK